MHTVQRVGGAACVSSTALRCVGWPPHTPPHLMMPKGSSCTCGAVLALVMASSSAARLSKEAPCGAERAWHAGLLGIVQRWCAACESVHAHCAAAAYGHVRGGGGCRYARGQDVRALTHA